LFVITNCHNNDSIVCCWLQIVSFPVGSLLYKHVMLSDANWILFCNLHVMSCLYGMHLETAQLHAQSPRAQLHAQSPGAQLHVQSPSALQTNMTTCGLQDRIQFGLNWIELNSIWAWALLGLMHLGLKTGPLCPMFCTKLGEPCSFSKVPDGPYT
jgi:hypothetical protein